MIQQLSYFGLLVAVILIVIDVMVFRPRRAALPKSALNKFERLVYFLVKLSVAVMALSSFGMIMTGEHMHHWMLTLHMSFAPLFAMSLTVMSLLWAHQCTFTRDDAGERFHLGEKIAFWLTIAAGFATISAAMLMMMPWFNSDIQMVLLKTHRFSALVLVVSAVFHAYRLMIATRASRAVSST